jgi:hypothetical protein
MRTFYYILVAFIIASCINPFDFSTSGSNSLITVEGKIFNVDSSFVSIKYSSPDIKNTFNIAVDNAVVTVFENENTQIRFFFNERAQSYLPERKSFLGAVGNTYQLRIELDNGKVYATKPQMMLPAANSQISDVYQSADNTFAVSADLSPKTGATSYYFFELISYKNAAYCAQCKNNQQYDLVDNSLCYTDFKSCNNLRRFTGQPSGFYGFQCEATTGCWNYVKIPDFKLFEDKNLSTGAARIVSLLDAPLSSFSDYFVEVHQSRISAEAYQYLRLLEQSATNTGTLFDPVPPLLVGNIQEESNPNDRPLGFFMVAGQQVAGYPVKRARVSGVSLDTPDRRLEFIETEITRPAPALFGCLDPPVAPCTANSYRTNITPKGWREAYR